jgi:hypothetical protein
MRALLGLVLLLSSPVFACPDLMGTYKNCQSSNAEAPSPSIIQVEQNVVNNIHQFIIRTTDSTNGDQGVEKYLADGKTRVSNLKDPENGTIIKTQTLASCSGQSLNVKLNITIDGQALASMDVKVTKENGQLVQVYKGENMGEAVNETVTCN